MDCVCVCLMHCVLYRVALGLLCDFSPVAVHKCTQRNTACTSPAAAVKAPRRPRWRSRGPPSHSGLTAPLMAAAAALTAAASDAVLVCLAASANGTGGSCGCVCHVSYGTSLCALTNAAKNSSLRLQPISFFFYHYNLSQFTSYKQFTSYTHTWKLMCLRVGRLQQISM